MLSRLFGSSCGGKGGKGCCGKGGVPAAAGMDYSSPSQEQGMPTEATDDVPMPPAPVVDPAAYVPAQQNVAQVSGYTVR